MICKTLETVMFQSKLNTVYIRYKTDADHQADFNIKYEAKKGKLMHIMRYMTSQQRHIDIVVTCNDVIMRNILSVLTP